ncbi:MAG: helix-turn-helix domain-containing protein, partial [Pseudomonadota bacterium]
ADLVWAEGQRVRPEKLALVDCDRLGRTDDDAAILGRAASALRRALTAPAPLDTADAVAAALGCRSVGPDGVSAAEDAWRTMLPPLAAERAEGWLAALAPLDAHPLTRAGFGFRVWLRGDPERFLEPAALAGSLVLARQRPDIEAGLTFLPIALGRPPTALRYGGPAALCLDAWLAAVTGAATTARQRLAQLDDWRSKAAHATTAMRGRGAPALADLLLTRPVVSAPVAARALGLTAARSRELLAAFERLGLVRELTGQGRFRYWQPALRRDHSR